jgi:Tol biopolymer transport system component
MVCIVVSLLLCAGLAFAEDLKGPSSPKGAAEEEAVEIIEVELHDAGADGAKADPGAAEEAGGGKPDDVSEEDTSPSGGQPPVGKAEGSSVKEAEAPAPQGPVPDEPPAEKESGVQALRPLYVRMLLEVEQGRNDSNPLWSPPGDKLAFERSIGDKKEIIIAGADGSIIEKVYYQQSGEGGGNFDLFLPAFMEENSYNAGISWSSDGNRFVFMSNGGTGNYDLYLSGLGGQDTRRLTEAAEKDGHAHWSPVSDQLVLVSGRGGKADLYLMDIATGEVMPLTQGEKAYLYPRWSPGGNRVVMTYGSNQNHDIYLIDDVAMPAETLRPLTTWTYDDLRPVWSPDGKKIAFYSNYNRNNDPKEWSLVVVSADGSDPDGEGLAAHVVATDVIPDIERGPAWMPDSRRIVYVRDARYEYNPIYMVDTREGVSVRIQTDTRMNHDVVCSADGTVAFRAQVEQWDQIFLMRFDE